MSRLYRLLPIYSLLAILLGLSILTICCKRVIEDVSVPPENKPGALINIDTISPRILDIHIPKFPAQNITIDQDEQTITVIIPPNWRKPFQDSVIFWLSAKAKWLKTGPTAINFCSGRLVTYGPVLPDDIETSDKPLNNPQELIVTNGTLRKTYKLYIKPAGDMYFESDSVYNLKSDEWRLPKFALYNIVDGGYFATQGVFTHKETGIETTQNLGLCILSDDIIIDLPALRLGEHSFRIRRNNGRVTTNALRFNLTQGRPYYSLFSYNLANDPTKGILIEGRNLYQQNNRFEVELWHNRTGVKYSLQPYKFSPTGTELVVPVPKGLQAGYYYSRLLMNGQPYSEQTSIIAKDNDQPVFYEFHIGGTGNVMSKHERKTILLKPGEQYGFMYGPYKRLPIQIRLTPLSGEKADYILKANVPTDYGSSPGIEVYPYFTIPADVRKGHYLVSLQYTTNEGFLQRGEPLERDIIID